jgi:predicted DNA-binding transcriptional regulator AlpA
MSLPIDLKSQRYLTEKEVAILTGRAVQTLRNDRHRRRGFPYRKIGKSVRYSLQEILAIMESHRIEPEAL